MADKLYPESPHILAENVSRRGMPDDVPRTWILTKRDRALSVKFQRRAIDAIGGVQNLVDMDTCHRLMVSEPERLAEILVERCRRYPMNGAALSRHSSHSRSGSESAVMPPPTPSTALPSSVELDRADRHVQFAPRDG